MIPNDFYFIAQMLKERSGFSLTADQIYLLESRLGPIIRQNNLISLEDLINSLKLNDEELKEAVIEAVSINNTRFFRNKYVFRTIEEFLHAELKQNPQKKNIKILSAGCASGQEPVSIGILLKEMNLPEDIQADIYALDMSHHIIDRAKKGVYTHYEVQKGLPIRLLLKYFLHKEEAWQVRPEVMKMIHYHVHNIMNVFYENDFDIILCRNMLSYMTDEAQKKALQNLHDVLSETGLLIVGASEVLHYMDGFEKVPDKMGCYCLKKVAQEQVSQPPKTAWTIIKKPLFKPAVPKKK